MNPEQICYKLMLAPYDSLLLVVSHYESPNSASLGQNFLQRKIQDDAETHSNLLHNVTKMACSISIPTFLGSRNAMASLNNSPDQ